MIMNLCDPMLLNYPGMWTGDCVPKSVLKSRSVVSPPEVGVWVELKLQNDAVKLPEVETMRRGLLATRGQPHHCR